MWGGPTHTALKSPQASVPFLASCPWPQSQLLIHKPHNPPTVFPLLAQRMPAFQRELSLVGQHRKIHIGLGKLEAWVEKCKKQGKDGSSLDFGELRSILDSFGPVLLEHLDQEVFELR